MKFLIKLISAYGLAILMPLSAFAASAINIKDVDRVQLLEFLYNFAKYDDPSSMVAYNLPQETFAKLVGQPIGYLGGKTLNILVPSASESDVMDVTGYNAKNGEYAAEELMLNLSQKGLIAPISTENESRVFKTGDKTFIKIGDLNRVELLKRRYNFCRYANRDQWYIMM